MILDTRIDAGISNAKKLRGENAARYDVQSHKTPTVRGTYVKSLTESLTEMIMSDSIQK